MCVHTRERWLIARWSNGDTLASTHTTHACLGTRVYYPGVPCVWEFLAGSHTVAAVCLVCCASAACSPAGLIAKLGERQEVGARSVAGFARRDLYRVAISRTRARSRASWRIRWQSTLRSRWFSTPFTIYIGMINFGVKLFVWASCAINLCCATNVIWIRLKFVCLHISPTFKHRILKKSLSKSTEQSTMQ